VLLAMLPLVLAGCPFDVSFLKTEPAAFVAQPDCGKPFILGRAETIGMGTGFATRLRQGTRWQCIGQVHAGLVYRTADQVVTVEASNIHEAQAVVNQGRLVGFYLPVERAWVLVNPPVELMTEGPK
jgi:hypothetical protein